MRIDSARLPTRNEATRRPGPPARGVLSGRKSVLVLVVAAHVALLWLWSPRAPPNSVPARRVRLVTVALPVVVAAREPESNRSVAAPSRPRRAAAEARTAAAGRGAGAAVASSAAPSAGPVAAAAASEPASAPKALDLALPAADALRSSPRSAALNDPRSNSPHLSAAERMAQTLGTDTRLIEEIRPDGSVRLRRGSGCVDARESRAAGLDPYNSAFLPKPRQVSAC